MTAAAIDILIDAQTSKASKNINALTGDID